MTVDLKAIRERAEYARPGADVPALLDLVDEQQRTIDATVGALLELEIETDEDGLIACCYSPRGTHALPCALDYALASAGFADQASRDAERARRSK